MKKSIIIIIILIAIGIVIGGFLIFEQNNEFVNMGNNSGSKFIIPDGFKVTNMTANSVVIANGKTVFNVYGVGSESIDSIFSQYKISHKNDTVTESSFDVDGTLVRVVTLDVNGTTIHSNYFYEKNGVTYHIYPNGVENINALKQIVSSTE